MASFFTMTKTDENNSTYGWTRFQIKTTHVNYS